ncbi:MAG: hypothetical protein ACREMA_07425 [Longimicrobiales bacterium]
MAILFTIYLFIVVALPLALGIAVSYRSLCRTRHCPLCGHESVAVNSWIGRASRKLGFQTTIQRRWCVRCSWQGYARLARSSAHPLIQLVNQAPAPPTAGCRTEPVRTLRVAEAEWRVLLQSWQEHGCYFGQLMFIGPAGHLRRDPLHPLAGPTQRDVFEQALSLSDHLLTYRLRDLVSD